MNEHDETGEDAIEMSVEDLQTLTNDNLNGSLQVRHKRLQLAMFAEAHHMTRIIYYTLHITKSFIDESNMCMTVSRTLERINPFRS
jgi:hypothetical protein